MAVNDLEALRVIFTSCCTHLPRDPDGTQGQECPQNGINSLDKRIGLELFRAYIGANSTMMNDP